MAQAQKTRYAILGALTIMPMSGYGIKKWIKDVTGSFWAESSGRVYPILAELLREKLVSCDSNQKTDKRNKKIYNITAHGKTALKKWLAEPANRMVARDELRLKLFYGKNITPKQYLNLLLLQQAAVEKELKFYQEKMEHIKAKHGDKKDAYYWILTLKGAIYHAKAELEWCKELCAIIRKDFKDGQA